MAADPDHRGWAEVRGYRHHECPAGGGRHDCDGKDDPYPTDARLYEPARAQLVVLAQEAWVELRQTYARLALRLALQVGRYAHAKQFRRMCKALKRLKGYTGRVMRDLRRHLGDLPAGASRDRIAGKIALVSHLPHQASKGGDKIYALHEALHEPEVDCISKGRRGCATSSAARSATLRLWTNGRHAQPKSAT